MEPVTLKLAHVVNEQDGPHIAALKFKELVETQTGKILVEIYPNAQLGDERTLLEGMQIGTVDMGVITQWAGGPTLSKKSLCLSCRFCSIGRGCIRGIGRRDRARNFGFPGDG